MIILQYQLTVHTKLLYVFRSGFRTGSRTVFRTSGVFKLLVTWQSFFNTQHLSFFCFIHGNNDVWANDVRWKRSLKVKFQKLNFNVYPAISSIVKANNFCSVWSCKCQSYRASVLSSVTHCNAQTVIAGNTYWFYLAWQKQYTGLYHKY